jgi:uncharacterized damage-inducible protein DinB
VPENTAETLAWTAPAVERTDFPLVAGEVDAVSYFLESQRETLLWKCAGLTADQLKVRPLPPSSMSLLGLVRHLAEVERIWFLDHVAGGPAAPYWKTPENNDEDFDGADASDAEADFAQYAAAVAAARQVVAGRSLDEVFTSTDRRGETLTYDLRMVMLHMIEEYARHLGHADLLREHLDGVTGA